MHLVFEGNSQVETMKVSWAEPIFMSGQQQQKEHTFSSHQISSRLNLKHSSLLVSNLPCFTASKKKILTKHTR